MFQLLGRLFSWLAQKIGTVVLIVLLALGCYALWLWVQDERAAGTRNAASVQVLTLERDRLLLKKAQLEQAVAEYRINVEQQRQRIEQAGRIIASLRKLESWWDWLVGNPPQQKANAEQLQKMQDLQREASGTRDSLAKEIKRSLWEKDGLEISVQRLDREIARAADAESGPLRYLERAWLALRWYLLLAVAAFVFGPTLWALVLYFGLASVAERSRPIQLGPPAALPAVGESHVSIDAVLQPGETLRIKEKFLQSSDEGLRRRTRFVLDWTIPFTSLACGLVELVEMRNGTTAPSRVTLSNSDDPHLELALLEVPGGASLVLRPSFLAGVVQPGDASLVIRRRWQILRLQAWVSGQFRFFEFVGPCRLIVAGSRGVRGEVMTSSSEAATPARRTNQDAVIGFTPGLRYRPVRAETFWGYYRGMNPLFDDLFSGEGLFLVQETAREPGAAARAGRFWAGVWGGILRVFGL